MSSLEIEAVGPGTIALETLTRDPDLACRAKGVNASTAREYAEAIKAGAVFPPVVVFEDPRGGRWLADGFHRCKAAELAGLTEIAADVREGSRKDALLYAAGANASHGLRRTNADKRRAVLLVLGNFPKWSDRKIADACGVGNKFVGDVRRSVCSEHTRETGETEPVAPRPPASDALVSRLGKALDRVIAEWPAERRAELRSRLLEVCTEPENQQPA